MAANTKANGSPAVAHRPPSNTGSESLIWVHVKATVVVLLEFIALQLVAVGLASGIYSLIPLLDPEFQRGFDDWMRAFQILSPTLSISGGAAIVLSSYFFHKLAREADQRAAEANQQAVEANQQAVEANQQAVEANQQAVEANQQAAEANQQAAEANQRAAVAEAAIEQLEAELAELRSERADRPARRRRRALR